MIELFVKAAAAYLLGGAMGGLLVGRIAGGVDLRRAGSGNVGATNALRTQGPAFAALVLAIDAGKGVAAVLGLPALPWPWADGSALPREWLGYACGVAVTLGHVFPVWFGFRGGKGVATLAGVYAALLPGAFVWMLAVFALVVALTGFVSLGSLTAAATALVYVAVFDARGALSAAALFTATMAALVGFTHRGNIVRLLNGTENRFEKLRVIGRWAGR